MQQMEQFIEKEGLRGMPTIRNSLFVQQPTIIGKYLRWVAATSGTGSPTIATIQLPSHIEWMACRFGRCPSTNTDLQA